MFWTFGGTSTNSEKNSNALIILQSSTIATGCNETTCAMNQCIAIIKTRTTNILVYNRKQELKEKKTRKKWKEEKKTQRKTVNLILSHVNLTFLLIEPYGFNHTHCTLWKNNLLMWRKVQFKDSICLKLAPKILNPGLSYKVALRSTSIHIENLFQFNINQHSFGQSMNDEGIMNWTL